MHGTPQIVARGFTTPEGPRWWDGHLWFSDIFNGTVYSLAASGELRVEVEQDDEVSGLGFLPDGRLLFVSGRERRVLRREPDGRVVEHADLRKLAEGPCNDMVVDGQGRAYVGNWGWNIEEQPLPPEPKPAAPLILVAPDGSARPVGTPLEFANGTTISPDGKTLIVAETFASRLSAFSIGPDGSLGDHRIWADTPVESPDGIALDAEGCVWVAMAFSGRAVRIAEGGEIRDSIDLPDFPGILAVVLGGEKRRTLYMLTVAVKPEGTEEAQRALHQSKDGAVVAVEVDVPGAGIP